MDYDGDKGCCIKDGLVSGNGDFNPCCIFLRHAAAVSALEEAGGKAEENSS
jgi:hypothetical protein